MRVLILSFAAIVSLSLLSQSALADPGRVSIGLDVTLLHGGLPSSGIEVDYNFNNMFSLGFSYLGSHIEAESIVDDKIEDADADINATAKASISRGLALVNLRYFPFAGSFHLTGGLGAGSLVSKLEVDSEASTESIDEEVTYDQTVGVIIIGNTWRWQHFYIGVDWLGYSAVLSSTKKTDSDSTITAGGALEEAKGEYDEFVDVLGENGGVVFLGLRIGTGF